jgi:nucleoside-diphosphate-sugar epimerase
MAHILVSGANGFVGSHLVCKLLELKIENKRNQSKKFIINKVWGNQNE